YLPVDRALPLLDQEQPDERPAYPRAVRRNSRRVSGGNGDQGRREGEGNQRAELLHREGLCHAPDQTDDDRRQEGLPNRDSDPPGLPWHSGRRRQERSEEHTSELQSR